jgi:hypothetical protein
MRTRYRIRELEKGLFIQVVHEASPVIKVLVTILAGIFAGVAASVFLSQPWWWLIAILVMFICFVGDITTRRAKLTATKVELLAQGHFQSRIKSGGRIVYMGNVRWLEFREESVGKNARSEPCGLFAVTTGIDACLLPFLNREQTSEVIAAIEAEFPGLAECWRAESNLQGTRATELRNGDEN